MEEIEQCRVIMPSELAQARNAINALLEFVEDKHPIPVEEKQDLRLAVHEAIVNAMIHGNRYNVQKYVELDYAIEKDSLIISVKDSGSGFDYEKYLKKKEPSLDDLLNENGRGLQIILNLMDKVFFNECGNEMTMVKKLK